MKKMLIICGLVFMFSTEALYAEKIENNGVLLPASKQVSKIEGTLDENLPTNPSNKVSGVDYDCPSGTKTLPTIPPLDNSILPNPDDPTSNMTYPGYNPVRKKPRSEDSQILDGPRWGNDILIVDKTVGEGQDFDEDEVTDHIYMAFDTYYSTNDSLLVYRSTNGGSTWSLFILGVNGDGEIGNPKVRVVRDAIGQSWVVFIGIWIEPTGALQLWSRRVRTDGSGATWEQIAADSVLWADIDGDVGTNAWCYCTFVKEGATWDYDIYASRNALAGSGWQNTTLLFYDPQVDPYPAIAAGAGGNVAVAFIDDRITTNQEVRIKRSTNYGNTWLASEQVSNNSGGARLSYTDIGYSHGTTQIGWIFVTFGWSDGDNVGYYYSTNSGVNWTYGGIMHPYEGNQNLSSVRCRKATGSITVAYNCDPGDSTMFTWTTITNPTGFGNGVRINDYAATGIWPPTAGWINRAGIGWSAIIYSSWAMNYRPYFDWFGNTGIAEENKQVKSSLIHLSPNPSNGVTKLSYIVKSAGNVRISLYDASGRLVNNLVNENKTTGSYLLNLDNQKLPNGVYFVRVQTPDGTISKTMTIVR